MKIECPYCKQTVAADEHGELSEHAGPDGEPCKGSNCTVYNPADIHVEGEWVRVVSAWTDPDAGSLFARIDTDEAKNR